MSPSERNGKTEKQKERRPQESANTEDENFEEVDLVFTEQELTRRNSWDFVVAEKKNDDEIHDLLHGKAEPPKVTVPAPALSASEGEVRRYRQPVDSVEMTNFARERDLEAGIVPETPIKKQEEAGFELC